MILLDTNVVSELMRPIPNPALESWIADRPAASRFFSAVGEAELRFGLASVPAGRRRDSLTAEIEATLNPPTATAPRDGAWYLDQLRRSCHLRL